eukprot:4199142-Pyramimonas_sp.AAC.1
MQEASLGPVARARDARGFTWASFQVPQGSIVQRVVPMRVVTFDAPSSPHEVRAVVSATPWRA